MNDKGLSDFIQSSSLLNQVEGAEKLFLSGRRKRGEDLESAVRFFLEFLHGFESFDFDGPCVTVFGSARFRERHRYYELARELGRALANAGYAVMTGGGPGIMEAANRGANDVGAKSVGLNIVLPHEQRPNPYVTPELCFQFRYFAIRKMHFLMRAKALVAFPGGYGTFDELFETLTLIQTGKVPPVPVVLFGREFWDRIVRFDEWVREGMITEGEAALFTYAETAKEAWEVISSFHTGIDHRMPEI